MVFHLLCNYMPRTLPEKVTLYCGGKFWVAQLIHLGFFALHICIHMHIYAYVHICRCIPGVVVISCIFSSMSVTYYQVVFYHFCHMYWLSKWIGLEVLVLRNCQVLSVALYIMNGNVCSRKPYIDLGVLHLQYLEYVSHEVCICCLVSEFASKWMNKSKWVS